MASDVDIGVSVDGYTGGVSTDGEGAYSVGFGYDPNTGETAPAATPVDENTPLETALEAVKPYAAPVGVALLLLLIAAALRAGK